MKKTISILVFGALPVYALAGGEHAGMHGMNSDHAMEQMQHGSHEMNGMQHDGHDAGAGRPGDPSKITRTIEVTMNDTMRFTPDRLKFKSGETVRFVVRNDGNIRHEMVIGSMMELKEHAEMMRNNPAMQHAEPNMVSLAPGQHGELVWQFDRPGTLEFACLVPGHLESGMTGKVEVE